MLAKYFLLFLSIVSLLLPTCIFSQQLKPGFDKEEYRELMLMSARSTAVPDYYKDFAEPKNFKMVYQSQTMGLDNLWDLWISENKVAAISIRGTTEKPESWLANFYAAMVPAKGELQLNEKEIFTYKLASNPKAAVHVGWLLSMAYLSKDILPKIDSLYKTGTKEFLLMGHSQGGAITFLLTAYLKNLQALNKLPNDIKFKTYCSAGPKPGNLYFAYEYEAMTQGGWAYNVANAADWVPEMPISIQTLNDFNNVNPFTNAKVMIKKQKFPKNLVLKHVYNRLDKPTKRAQNNYEKYLGELTSKIIKNNISGFSPPLYYNSNHYVRTGETIVLLPDDDYFKQFPDDPTKLFPHHFHAQYLMLLDKLPASNSNPTAGSLIYTPSEMEIKMSEKNQKEISSKKVFIHNQLGIQIPDLDALNTAIAGAGFMKLDKIYLARGGGFYTIFPKAHLATLFNYSTYSANMTADGFTNSVRGTTIGSSLGISIFKKTNIQLIPYGGIVYSWFGARLSNTNVTSQTFAGYLNGGANQEHIASKGFIGNVGLHFAIMPCVKCKLLKNFTLGVRAGSYVTLKNTQWTTNEQSLNDGPNINTQGVYANITLGFAL